MIIETRDMYGKVTTIYDVEVFNHNPLQQHYELTMSDHIKVIRYSDIKHIAIRGGN